MSQPAGLYIGYKFSNLSYPFEIIKLFLTSDAI